MYLILDRENSWNSRNYAIPKYFSPCICIPYGIQYCFNWLFGRILAYASVNIYLYVPIHVHLLYITYIDQLLPGRICKCWQQIIFLWNAKNYLYLEYYIEIITYILVHLVLVHFAFLAYFEAMFPLFTLSNKTLDRKCWQVAKNKYQRTNIEDKLNKVQHQLIV